MPSPWRSEFPIFEKDRELVYLDSAATALKPRVVIEAMNRYYTEYSANVHRGLYPIAAKATDEYENARKIVADFINADPSEIVFTRSATEAINLVAYAWGRTNIKAGDQIIISDLEHHSNIVPWQMLCEERNAELLVWEMESDGSLPLERLERLLTSRTRLVAITGMSNVLGTIPPISDVIKLAHKKNIPVLIDAAQLITHRTVDVGALGCDFLVFSGHKLYGPTGIGVLYGKKKLLAKMPPFEGGGEMIKEVTFRKTTYKDPPHKFEPGTPPIAEAIGLGAAIEFVQSIGMERIAAHEDGLAQRLVVELGRVPGLTVYGPKERGPLAAFNIEGVHAHDVGTLLGEMNIAVRSGHHCTMPLHKKLGVPATSRASLGMYNGEEDIEKLVIGLKKVRETFGRQ
jgi:cysteine desulfurase/selenocysteine lyase